MADLFNYVQGKPFYSLSGNGINAAATQVTVSDFTLPDGTNITMSMFGDTGYGTFEPGTDKEENFSFTGVTQNGNGTATLTGLTRGLRFVSPYTADSGLAQGHGGNTPMVLSNSAPFYNELSGKDNDETITGTWTFTAPNYPQIDDPDNPPTQDEQFVTKKLLDDTAFAGANLNKIVVDAIAGETIAENDIVYFDESDNEWRLAAATFVDQTNYLVGLAMGAGTNGNAIDGGVMLEGIKTGFSGFTQGDIQYLSDTGGEISTSPGTIFFELGYAQSTTQLYFTPKFKSFITKNQKDALAGTSGTPSTSNKYVTDDDTAITSTADAVVRADGSGLVDSSWLPDVATNIVYSEGYTAGEDITSGDAVRMGVQDQTDDLHAFLSQTTSDSQYRLDTANKYQAQSFLTGSTFTERLGSVTFRFDDAGSGGTNRTFRIRLYDDNSGEPGSQLYTFTEIVLVSGTMNHEFVLPVSQVLTASTTYWVSIELDSGLDVDIYYNSTSVYADGYRATTTDGGSSWTQETTNDLYLVVSYTDTSGRVYQASALGQDIADAMIGFANNSVSTGDADLRVDHLGIISTVSGITSGDTYYLSDTPGALATSNGTVTKKVAIGLTSTSVLSTLGF